MPLVGERCRWSALDLFEEIDRPPLSVDRRHFFGSSHGYYTQLAFRPDSPHVARSPSSSSRTDSAEGRLAAAPPRSIVGYTRPTTNVRPIPQRHHLLAYTLRIWTLRLIDITGLGEGLHPTSLTRSAAHSTRPRRSTFHL